ALRAWQASQGFGPTLDAGAPLLFSLETLTFFLAGASEAAARFWPYLASVAALPAWIAWRRYFKRDALLLAAALLTFSPLFNAFARRGDSTAFALLALILALAGWWRVREGEKSGWVWMAVGLGVMFIAGATGPSALIALLLVMALTRSDGERPSIALNHFLIFLTVVLVGGTAFFTRLDALGLAALNWSDWLAAFTISPAAWSWGAIRLFTDEALIMPVGLVAAIWLWRRPGLERGLALAGLILALVAVLQGPYAAGTRAVAALLLALPAAMLILHLARSVDLSLPEALLYGFTLQAIVIIAGLALVGYARHGDQANLILLAATLSMMLLLSITFGFFMGARLMFLMSAWVVTITLALYSLSMAWAMGYDYMPPRFPALYETDTRIGVFDLEQAAGDVSERVKGDRWSLPITLVEGSSSDDVLHWQLRRAPEVRRVISVGPESAAPLVVAPAAYDPPLEEQYAGSTFYLFDAWDPVQGDLRQKIAWLLFRTAPWDIPTENEVLWVDVTTLVPE
ncbi:MAG: hypothetical protein GXP42_14555, partial [Chloroflexi bacterium]|nr:hypothetical protein [Chloroflexota bacterium]